MLKLKQFISMLECFLHFLLIFLQHLIQLLIKDVI